MQHTGLTGRTGDEIRGRLGIQRLGQPRAVDALARVVEGERLDVVCVVARGVWDWSLVATDAGVWLARRPRVFGRARDDHFAWDELTAVNSRNQCVELVFGERTLRVTVVSQREHGRLLDAARRHLSGVDVGTTMEGLRGLVADDLGRRGRVEFALTLEHAAMRLQTGECVERVARASLDFSGLLLVTDLRLLLLEDSILGEPRAWSLPRHEIRSATLVTGGVCLDVDGPSVTLSLAADAALGVVSALLPDAASEHAAGAARDHDWLLGVRPREPLVPTRAWELTAPESYALRYANSEPVPFGLFVLAIQELVARDALRLEGAEIAGLVRVRRQWLLTDGPSLASISEPVLIAAAAIYTHARKQRTRMGARMTAPADDIEGILLADLKFEKAAWAELGHDFERAVVDSLWRRGLLSGRRNYSEAGSEADDLLDAWIALGKARLVEWAAGRHNLPRAVEYLRGAGASVLLVPDALPALDILGARLRAEDIELASPAGTPIGAPDGNEDLPAPTSASLGAIACDALVREVAGLSGLDEMLTTVYKGMRTIIVTE